MPAKPTHGGLRPGAGRKRGVPRKPFTVRLSEPARAALNQAKRDTGKGYSEILEALILHVDNPRG